MFYQKNVPMWERVLRIVGGAIFISIAVFGPQWWGSQSPVIIGLLLFSAAFVIVTGFIGWCPACALVGRKLAKESKKRQS